MAILDGIQPFSSTADRDDGDLVTVAFTGEIDLSVAEQFSTAISEGRDLAGRLRLDFEHCTFIDSSGIQVVVDNARRCRDDGSELSVTNLRGDVAKAFQVTGLLSEGSPLHHEST